MKRLKTIILIICLICLLTGCGKSKENTDNSNSTNVTTEDQTTITTTEDKEQIKKESVDKLYNYLRDNATDIDDGVNFIKIDEIDDTYYIGLGVNGTNICMKYYRVSTDKSDIWFTTIVFDDSFEKASFKYRYIWKLMFSSTYYDGTGNINFARYKLGDMVTFDEMKRSSTNDKDVVDVRISESDQNSANRNVKSCLEKLKEYLDAHPEIGCKYEDLQLDIGQ